MPPNSILRHKNLGPLECLVAINTNMKYKVLYIYWYKTMRYQGLLLSRSFSHRLVSESQMLEGQSTRPLVFSMITMKQYGKLKLK